MAEGGWGSGTWGEAGWGMSVYYRSASETATTSDTEAVAGSTFLSAFTATGQIVDDIATTPTLFAGVENETAVGGVTLTTASIQNVSVDEATTVSDANFAQQVFARAVNEDAAGADAVIAQKIFASAVSESATGADVLASSFAYFADANETATAADTTTAQHVMSGSVDESATGSDTTAASHVLGASVSEDVAASVEAVVAASLFSASLASGVTVTDLLSARRLWEQVDDIQNANWQNINTV